MGLSENTFERPAQAFNPLRLKTYLLAYQCISGQPQRVDRLCLSLKTLNQPPTFHAMVGLITDAAMKAERSRCLCTGSQVAALNATVLGVAMPALIADLREEAPIESQFPAFDAAVGLVADSTTTAKKSQIARHVDSELVDTSVRIHLNRPPGLSIVRSFW